MSDDFWSFALIVHDWIALCVTVISALKRHFFISFKDKMLKLLCLFQKNTPVSSLNLLSNCAAQSETSVRTQTFLIKFVWLVMFSTLFYILYLYILYLYIFKFNCPFLSLRNVWAERVSQSSGTRVVRSSLLSDIQRQCHVWASVCLNKAESGMAVFPKLHLRSHTLRC